MDQSVPLIPATIAGESHFSPLGPWHRGKAARAFPGIHKQLGGRIDAHAGNRKIDRVLARSQGCERDFDVIG
jgi:hypothetical protein